MLGEDLDQECVSIPLGSRKYPGLYAIVDAADAERVSSSRWSVMKSKHSYYACRMIVGSDGKDKMILMHRFLMDAPKGMQVDHINGNGIDNRRSVNLRLATDAQNKYNRVAYRGPLQANKSGYKGVRACNDSPKWQAGIRHNGRTIHIGRFATLEGAARAYDAKARELFGDFANLNFPG